MNKFFLLDDDDICFDPDQHAEFDFYRASALEQHHTCISMNDKHASLHQAMTMRVLVMYLCDRYIERASYFDFSILF
jgi:hypothetical protein